MMPQMPRESDFEKLEIQIKAATVGDAEEIHRIHTSAVTTTCKECYTEKQINAWIGGRIPEGYYSDIMKGEMFVAKENDKIVGFCHAVPGEIMAIFVDPVYQGKKIGEKLFDYGMKIASNGFDKIKIDAVLNAVGFYEKYGFVKTKDHYVIRKGIEIPITVMEYLKPSLNKE